MQLAEELEGYDLSVITRSGHPAKPSEQQRVSAVHAETIVLLYPDGLSPAAAAAQQAATLSALQAGGGAVRGQRVVVQGPGADAAAYDAAEVRCCSGYVCSRILLCMEIADDYVLNHWRKQLKLPLLPHATVTQLAVQLARASGGGDQVVSLTTAGSERLSQLMAQVCKSRHTLSLECLSAYQSG